MMFSKLLTNTKEINVSKMIKITKYLNGKSKDKHSYLKCESKKIKNYKLKNNTPPKVMKIKHQKNSKPTRF